MNSYPTFNLYKSFRKGYLILFLFFLSGNSLWAQADSLDLEISEMRKPKKWLLNGYVKNMQTVYFFDSLGPGIRNSVLLDNLVHNRINFSWFINDKFTFKVDLRNRIFMGETMKFTPDFGNRIDSSSSSHLFSHKAWYSPSWLLVNKKDLVIHSMIDRLYIDFVKNKWELRLGRQRINWGITNFWNPHDIFNAYNFTDFDYEERPGSDALRVTYYPGMLSKLEFAVQAFDKVENINAGMLWKFNKWNYDFQVISGFNYENIVAGVGWAGGIKNMGFKGEASYFYALQDSVKHSVVASLNFDYMFSNSLFLNGGLLFNSNGIVKGSSANLLRFQLSAKNIYPYRYSAMLSLSYPFSPLIGASLSIVYSLAEQHAMYISPMFSYSIKENWDINLIGQLIFGKENRVYKSPTQLLFLRLKWSF